MKFVVLFTLLVLASPSYAEEETGETCRSYVIDHSLDKKYCLRDLDEKIEKYNIQLQAGKSMQDLRTLQDNSERSRLENQERQK